MGGETRLALRGFDRVMTQASCLVEPTAVSARDVARYRRTAASAWRSAFCVRLIGSDMRSHAHCLVEDVLHRIRALLSSLRVFEY
jgi:hypothetical protein